MNQLNIEWSPADYAATWPANPAYPSGEAIDVHPGAARSCLAGLRYPAPSCGAWSIRCQACRRMVVVTATGQADDPRWVRIGCEGGARR
jgi:hypothetical protein